MSKPLFTYTTQIDPVKTITEIQTELAEHGAESILIDYENKVIVALSFKIETKVGVIGIRLPCDHRPVLKVLERQYDDRDIARGFVSEEQAYRVAWRIVLYWVKAQMAILEAEMVTMDQVFLPYVVSRSGKTLYQEMLDSKFQITGDTK